MVAIQRSFLAWPGLLLLAGCTSGRTEDRLRVVLEELTIVRQALKLQQEQLQSLERALVAAAQSQNKNWERRFGELERRLAATATATTPAGKAPEAASPTGSQDLSRLVTVQGGGRYRLKRAFLDQMLSNTTQLARAARIVPFMRQGRITGFKLYAIRLGSPFSLLGLRNGDVLVRMNGVDLTSPDKALEAYTRIRSARQVTLEGERQGQPLILRYTISN